MRIEFPRCCKVCLHRKIIGHVPNKFLVSFIISALPRATRINWHPLTLKIKLASWRPNQITTVVSCLISRIFRTVRLTTSSTTNEVEYFHCFRKKQLAFNFSCHHKNEPQLKNNEISMNAPRLENVNIGKNKEQVYKCKLTRKHCNNK